MNNRVLWLDNDPGHIQAYVATMRRAGLDVTVARTVSEAEHALGRDVFDVLLLDVMIPVTDAEESGGYASTMTDEGYKTGLAFFQKHRAELAGRTAILVLTVRVDHALREEFVAAGLPPENFMTKMEVRDASKFLSRVRRHIPDVNTSPAGG